MNIITKEIAERFNLKIEDALAVQEIEEEWCDVHYGNDSQRKINKAHDEAFLMWTFGVENFFKQQAKLINDEARKINQLHN